MASPNNNGEDPGAASTFKRVLQRSADSFELDPDENITTKVNQEQGTSPKRSPRHAPPLPRLQRVESEVEFLESGDIQKTNDSPPISPPSLFKDAPPHIQMILNQDPKDTSPSTSNGSKSWLARSVSKIISDKSFTGTSTNNNSQNIDKKRSKSPSTLLEYAQKKFPKWASFARKSDDDETRHVAKPSSSATTPTNPTLKQSGKSTEKILSSNSSYETANSDDDEMTFQTHKSHSFSFFRKSKKGKETARKKSPSGNPKLLTTNEGKSFLSKQRSRERTKGSSKSTDDKLSPKSTPAHQKFQSEFLNASMRIFLVVSPPAGKFKVRSKSLTSLQRTEEKPPSYHLLDPMFRKLTRSSSTPEITALNFSSELKYNPGPTKGKSVFVRRQKNKLKHTNSQASQKNFLHLKQHSSGGRKSSANDDDLFVPAIGGTSIKSALQNIWLTEGTVLNVENGPQQLPVENVDLGEMAGKTGFLSQARGYLFKKFFRKASLSEAKTHEAMRGFSSSTEDPSAFWAKTSSADATYWPSDLQGLKAPSFKTNQRWTLFKSKDPVNMERLVDKLNEFSELGTVPILPCFRNIAITAEIYDALLEAPELKLEYIFDLTRLPEEEVRRQRIVMELITTEATYISNLRTLVELFYSTAHALQEDGIMGDVDLERIFCNLPEVLNSNLNFWKEVLYPMLMDALSRKHNRFNTQLLYEGFATFRIRFEPYDRYVKGQKNFQNYSRDLIINNVVYTAYVTWCESQVICKRLKLHDMMVKPMQRLTKYLLLLHNIAELTFYEPERTTLKRLYRNSKKFVSDIDNSIRVTEDLDDLILLNECIESYDVIDVKEEDIEKLLRGHMDLNFLGPIPGCNPLYRRSIVMQGDLKFKDSKDVRMEIRGILLSDMFLICAISKKRKPGQQPTYRLIRPKYMVDKMVIYPQLGTKDNSKELTSLFCVVLDDTGTAVTYFRLYETATSVRDDNMSVLRRWEYAFREAQETLNLARQVSVTNRTLSDSDNDSLSDMDKNKKKTKKHEPDSDEKLKRVARKKAHRRVYTMQFGLDMSFDNTTEGPTCGTSGVGALPSRGSSRASSRASRLSSLQQSYSGSYDINEWTNRRSGDTSTGRRTTSMSSEEGFTPLYHYMSEYMDVTNRIASMRGSQRGGRPGTPPRSNQTPTTCSAAANMLSVLPPPNLGQSMPNLTSNINISHQQQQGAQRPNQVVSINVPNPQDRGRNVYLRAGQPGGQLSPDTRGTSYPPPSPTRASLQRGFAFSSTIKNPPLLKSRHLSRETSRQSSFTAPSLQNRPIGTLKLPPSSPVAPTPEATAEELSEAVNVHSKGGHYLTIPTSSFRVEQDRQNPQPPDQ